ncbi:MAG: acetyl-CoA carboxylase biotin carboxylase subunit [Planctomycetota bacterium]|nr:acetyl-CoA carboxylase biotin carboxylase subunit [Planctomycetota bacterium]
MFSRILIANRGEIALRIIRACKELGIETVAIFSETDRDAGYLRLADDRICIGPAPVIDSYLNIPRIIAAAELADVQAIHPGYGFLAENSHFAEVCRSCKIEFIGPSVETMRLLGDKIRAKALARSARVPTAPDSNGVVNSAEDAVTVAEKIGYPVVLKAAAGGGGRGIRFAHNQATLKSLFKQAQREAEISFKDGRLYMEKCVENFRHIEVQILGDMDGNIIHLYERECSLQRRQQKVIEETPAPNIDARMREEICEAAVRMAKAADYHNVGTVEFMLDEKNHEFYFLEVNTRIQVEHPVTEMVTGQDLLKWQLKLATGEPLDMRQRDISIDGHSIECRINAEDPANGFRPSPGRIEAFSSPGGFGVRWDSHVYQGYEIPSNYDSLIGKLIVHGRNRDEAVSKMRRALDEFFIYPTRTTVSLCRDILNHQAFQKGRYNTAFIEREMLSGSAMERNVHG